jgi:tRNA threonylcarbamoyl adenosine modification protein (Sua5/YciO/YrdC/YwlC family)
VRSTIPDAVEAVRAGGLVVVPTDTVYGIGCAPSDPEAIDRLFEAKRRPRSLVLPVLLDGVAAAERLGQMDERARRLAVRFWPGALTLVLPRSEESASWPLGEGRDTIGLRVPASATAMELVRAAGPLAVTSANLSGAPTPATCEGVRAVFGTAVAVYLCEDEQIAGRASTVVDVAGGRILREGDLAEEVAELL